MAYMVHMLRVAFAAGAVALALDAAAQSTGRTAFVMGIGTNSCAWWLSSEATKNAGQHYIIGFLSGMNIARAELQDVSINSNVGRNTDSAGWIGEVEKACREAPSEFLVQATLKAYRKLSAIER